MCVIFSCATFNCNSTMSIEWRSEQSKNEKISLCLLQGWQKKLRSVRIHISWTVCYFEMQESFSSCWSPFSFPHSHQSPTFMEFTRCCAWIAFFLLRILTLLLVGCLSEMAPHVMGFFISGICCSWTLSRLIWKFLLSSPLFMADRLVVLLFYCCRTKLLRHSIQE